MPIVDSHTHVARSWYEPIETLLFAMDRNGVDQAVLIQMRGQTDNSYQAECVRRYPGRFASVVIVDAQRLDAEQALQRLAEEGASGVRFHLPLPSPGDDPLAIWKAAARLGLPVSCGADSTLFASPDFASAVQAVPDLPIVVEHLGHVNHPVDDPQQEALRRKVFELAARCPNLYVKIHGLGEFCRRAMPPTEPFPFVQPIPPTLEEAYRAFGAHRMMWGSDFPPVAVREGYANALRLTMEQLAHLPQAERDQIFGGTAASVFKLA
jgi:L-fuconolactonase